MLNLYAAWVQCMIDTARKYHSALEAVCLSMRGTACIQLMDAMNGAHANAPLQ
jgi:hypothetical protein